MIVDSVARSSDRLDNGRSQNTLVLGMRLTVVAPDRAQPVC
jgi:hypothetical protein